MDEILADQGRAAGAPTDGSVALCFSIDLGLARRALEARLRSAFFGTGSKLLPRGCPPEGEPAWRPQGLLVPFRTGSLLGLESVVHGFCLLATADPTLRALDLPLASRQSGA